MKSHTSALDAFRPIIAFEQSLSRKNLSNLRITFFILFISCLVTLITIQFTNSSYTSGLLGSTLIFFALWLEQVLLFCYHNTFYFRGFDSVIGSGTKGEEGISYEVAQILLQNENDITAAFTQSILGLEIMIRSGVSADSVISFLQSNRNFLTAADFPLNTNRITDIIDLGTYIYMYDLDFKQWLSEQAVTYDVYRGALQFVAKNHIRIKSKERWWSRDQLSLHTGIGRELTYGTPYELERFSYSLTTVKTAIDQNNIAVNHLKVIQKIEHVLAKDRSANILFITETSAVALDLLTCVQNRVLKGDGLNALVGLHFFVFDYKHLLSHFTEKNELENEITYIFNQAAQSGTHVIIIPDLSHLIAEAALRQINIPQVIEHYLTLSTLHIIGIDTPENYHAQLRTEHVFKGRFEEILLEPASVVDTITVLETIALRQEKRRGVMFTYSAIISIAEHADRHLVTGNMPERAIDFIHEVAQAAAKQGTVLITQSFIDEMVSKKTGQPLGVISPSERDRLLNLEEVIHKRVVGQERAVHAIASTMRRARVAVERTDKPMGSFLFLGSTGVGKTETAKALAHTFFGDETNMIRFNMSEFSRENSVAYLMGDENGTGSLTDALLDHPYCVLLLDEFEKAAKSVQDLFLQILDEGYFTSNHGTRVNARNTIIVATSNAGSDLIRKTATVRQSLPNLDADIISHIIETGIFKSELINRFDTTIIFEPLGRDQLELVAKLMLQDLTKRVTDQGYNLLVTPALITLLVDLGNDPHSGGRKINRVIQNVLEEKIATKIISGEVKRGGYIQLDLDDFTEKELGV